jgi:ubiquinone/menaquinone biosynthesis C-methylase UbiE
VSNAHNLNQLFLKLCPPILVTPLKSAYRNMRPTRPMTKTPGGQDLDVYWDPAMAAILETWGEGTVWNEIQLIMAGRTGTCLDIACGTGKTMDILNTEKGLDIWGCDISDRLIDDARKRGLRADRLHVGDATQLPYAQGQFDYSYSIGSIEHFTEDGIVAMLRECRRVTRTMAFHNHPISRSGQDEGWIKTIQSYFNNSTGWWEDKYKQAFDTVVILDSKWEDERSVGKWFVCS